MIRRPLLILAALTLGAVGAFAELQNCVERGPYYWLWTCSQNATITLSPISVSPQNVICVGQTISARASWKDSPALQRRRWDYDCQASHYQTLNTVPRVTPGWRITGPYSGSGSGIYKAFTPVGPGVGTIEMTIIGTIAGPCGVTPSSITRTASYVAVGVGQVQQSGALLCHQSGDTITLTATPNPSGYPLNCLQWERQLNGGAWSAVNGGTVVQLLSTENPGRYTYRARNGAGDTWKYSEEIVVVKVDTETVATVPADRTRKKVGVGEEVELTLDPSSLSPVTWSISGDGALSATTGNPVTFTAHDQASAPTITATYGGTPCAVTFNVVEPSHETAVKQGPDYSYPPGVQGAGLDLEVTVHPTDVSFANVEFREVSGPATGHTGYFTNYPGGQPNHSAGVWQLLSFDNKWYDEAAFSYLPSPWSAGSFQWVIPMEWRVIGSSQIGTLPDRTQVFTIHGTNGMSTVSKLGQSATRTP